MMNPMQPRGGMMMGRGMPPNNMNMGMMNMNNSMQQGRNTRGNNNNANKNNMNLQNRLRGSNAELASDSAATKLACVFRTVPRGGDASFLRCILETTNLTVRKSLELKMVDAKHIALMVRWVMLKMVQADLQMLRNGDLTVEDAELLKLSCKQLAHATSKSAKAKDSPTSVEQIFNIKRTIAAVEKVIRNHEEIHNKRNSGNSDTPPELKLYSNSIDAQNSIKNYNFGRFRRDGFDVEHLCGDSNKPPIFRPIQLTLVQDKVKTFSDAATCLRHCSHLCTKLAYQHRLVKNTFCLRVSLIRHICNVMPMPLPEHHPRRKEQCFGIRNQCDMKRKLIYYVY